MGFSPAGLVLAGCIAAGAALIGRGAVGKGDPLLLEALVLALRASGVGERGGHGVADGLQESERAAGLDPLLGVAQRGELVERVVV
ncbi:hypothetical protein DB354_10200 [Opitutus sp. ER46]|nr:hypothetical protein DB354_10200 [Opitutus sp. ER46]